MSLFNKKDNKREKLDLSKPQPMSGGNMYDLYNKLKTQENIDFSTLPTKSNYKTSLTTLSELNNKYLEEFTIPNYYLLLLHSNYFTNTVCFDCDNWRIKKLIIKIINQAWLYGKAGIYFNKKVNKAYGIMISNIEYNTYGEITKINYCEMSLYENKEPSEWDKDSVLKTIQGNECNNVAIFNWGSLAVSAFIIYYPFVKLQNLLLQMGTTQAFSYNKKFAIKLNSPEQLVNELELWYNPLNAFIGYTDDVGNRIKIFENTGGSSSNDFIAFYKEIIGIYYSLFGRRMNFDFKKERNNLEEVSLTSSAIETVERDWLEQFKIFVEELKEINTRLKIWDYVDIYNIKLNSWAKDEREQGIFDKDSVKENNITDNKER